jgi:hypothetical protein
MGGCFSPCSCLYNGPNGLQYQGDQARLYQTCSQDMTHCPAFHDKCSLYWFLYSGTFSITYKQSRKLREYMSQCNTRLVGGYMIQSIAVKRYQPRLSYNIQHMGETLQWPTQKVRVQVCRGYQDSFISSIFL